MPVSPRITDSDALSPSTSSNFNSAMTLDSSSDPASSLRAAALLTLKSKRRKAVPVLPPTRPLPPDTGLQLDYGQEETPMSGVETKLSSPPPPPTPPSATLADKVVDDDSQGREEGEISEEEGEAPHSPPLRSGHSPPGFRHKTSTPSLKPQSPPPPRIQSDTASLTASDGTRYPVFYFNGHRIDADHVRPGLAMTQHQYETAKDIILDLLGWGVPPEFLIACGLSREVIFYTFTELNLRLPPSLDVTGLVPFIARHTRPRSVGSHSSSTPSHQFTKSATPEVSQARQPSPVPSASGVQSSETPPVEEVPQQSITPGSLHDMERQRRQELLARKAVLASRKSKANETSPSRTPYLASKEDVEMVTPIATEAVDDFLKSIEPPQTLSRASPPPVEPPPDAMDVDNAPILESERPSPPMDTPADILPTSRQPSPISLADALPPREPPLTPEVLPERQAQSRRGLKRPVASDFVDFDTSPRQSSAYSGGHLNPNVRRKTNSSFATLSGMRRCVIDLSDSEGDDNEEHPTDGKEIEKRNQSSYASPDPSRPSFGYVARSGVGTPTTGTQSPAALLEKEMEIQKMRELIAQREQDRLKKRASRLTVLETAAPSTGLASPITASSVSVKQEDSENSPTFTEPKSAIVSQSPQPEIPSQPTPPKELELPVVDVAASLSSITSPRLGRIASSFGASLNGNAEGLTSSAHPTTVQGGGIEDDTAEGSPASNVEHPPDGVVDVDLASSSSAEMMKASSHPERDASQGPSPDSSQEHDFVAYDSPFSRYPMLRSRHVVSADRAQEGTSNASSDLFASSSSQTRSPHRDRSVDGLTSPVDSSAYSLHTTVRFPNLRPLRTASFMKQLDPMKRVCQYEVPGGGECVDARCGDVHLSRLEGVDGFGAEPSDVETAEYLYNALPTGWMAQHNVSSSADILAALEQVRSKTPLLDLDQRVGTMLALLDTVTVPTTPPPPPRTRTSKKGLS